MAKLLSVGTLTLSETCCHLNHTNVNKRPHMTEALMALPHFASSTYLAEPLDAAAAALQSKHTEACCITQNHLPWCAQTYTVCDPHR